MKVCCSGQKTHICHLILDTQPMRTEKTNNHVDYHSNSTATFQYLRQPDFLRARYAKGSLEALIKKTKLANGDIAIDEVEDYEADPQLVTETIDSGSENGKFGVGQGTDIGEPNPGLMSNVMDLFSPFEADYYILTGAPIQTTTA